MNWKLLSGLFFSVLLVACSSDNGGYREINLNTCIANSTTVMLSEIASDIEYIIFETKPTSYIGEISFIRFFENRVIVADRRTNCIHVFDIEGNHLVRINSIGKGPGEYIGISWMDICEQDGSIYLLDNSTSKLLQFSLIGDFITELKVDGAPSAFKTSEKITFLHVFPNSAHNDNYSLSILDLKTREVRKFLKVKPFTAAETFYSSAVGDFYFANSCDTLTYWEYKKDRIYKILDEDVIESYRFRYSHGKSHSDVDVTSKIDIYGVVDACNYIFIYGDSKGNPFRVLYDKRSGRGKCLPLSDADELNYGFINDVDGGYTFYPEGITSDGRLIMRVSMYRLKIFLENGGSTNIEALNPLASAKLDELVKKASLEDNYCIMLVTLK